MAEKCRIAVYTDLEEMIAAGVCDAVHILTPPPLHQPLARRCLKPACMFSSKSLLPFQWRLKDMAAAAGSIRTGSRRLS